MPAVSLAFSLGGRLRKVVQVMSTAAVEYSTMMVIVSSWQAEYIWLKGREGKGREGKGREGKGRTGQDRTGKARKGKERKLDAFQQS